jgi:hypothetical protein
MKCSSRRSVGCICFCCNGVRGDIYALTNETGSKNKNKKIMAPVREELKPSVVNMNKKALIPKENICIFFHPMEATPVN